MRKKELKGLSVATPDTDTGDLSGAFDDGLGFLGGSGEMSPVWGALLGTGLASTGILIGKSMRAKSPKAAKYAGLIGLAAAGIPSAAALFFPKTRRAAYLGLATGTIVAVSELIRSMYVEPSLGEYDVDGFGMYQPEMTDGYGEVQILGEGDDYGDYGDYGAGTVEVMGQTTPQEAMGMYQPEMTGIGASPIDVMGGMASPYSGVIAGW